MLFKIHFNESSSICTKALTQTFTFIQFFNCFHYTFYIVFHKEPRFPLYYRINPVTLVVIIGNFIADASSTEVGKPSR